MTEFDAGRYLTQRRLTEAGVGELEPGPALTAVERSARIRRGRERHGIDLPVAREQTLAAARATYGGGGSLPRSSGRRVETNSGRPGTLTRGPGLAPAAMVDALRSSGADARVCGRSTCKAILISHEGPAREFCPEHG